MPAIDRERVLRQGSIFLYRGVVIVVNGDVAAPRVELQTIERLIGQEWRPVSGEQAQEVEIGVLVVACRIGQHSKSASIVASPQAVRIIPHEEKKIPMVLIEL